MDSNSDLNCALNDDGSLKDAKDIPFYNSPSDARPISFDSYVAARAGTESPSPSIRARPLASKNRNTEKSETENTLEKFNITVKTGKRARGDADTQPNKKLARSQVSKPRKSNAASKTLTGMSRSRDDKPRQSKTAKCLSKSNSDASKGRDDGAGAQEEESVEDGVVTEEDGEKDDDDNGDVGGRGSNVKAVSDIMTFAMRMEDGRFRCDMCV